MVPLTHKTFFCHTYRSKTSKRQLILPNHADSLTSKSCRLLIRPNPVDSLSVQILQTPYPSKSRRSQNHARHRHLLPETICQTSQTTTDVTKNCEMLQLHQELRDAAGVTSNCRKFQPSVITARRYRRTKNCEMLQASIVTSRRYRRHQ